MSQELGAYKLYKALSVLAMPTADSSKEAFRDFATALQGIMIEHRNIGHDWDFTLEQAGCLIDYFYANRLLVECLDLAVISNRAAIEDSLLLPPGDWTAEDWIY